MFFDSRLTPARPDLAADFLKDKMRADHYVQGMPFTIKETYANLKKIPDMQSETQTQLLYGHDFIVYEQKGSWAWGQHQTDGYVGYLSASDLTQKTDEPTHRISALRTFLYAEPNIKTPPIGWLSMNSKISATKYSDTVFHKLSTGNAFVFSEHLEVIHRHNSQDFVSIAEHFLYVPYYWGGNTSLGLDCSALVQVSLHAAGKDCPRDSDMQFNFFPKKSPDSPFERGDLVFWKGHVGIMTDSQNLLHANATFMQVTYEPLEIVKNRNSSPITGIRYTS